MANEKLYLSKLQEFINMYVLEPSQRLQEKEKKKQTQKNGEALKFDSNEMSIDLPVDSNGRTPLHYAVIGNSYKVAELLLKHGADHSRIDSFSTTPINMVRNPDTAEGQKMLDLLLNASVKKQQDSHDEFMKQREMEMEFEGDLLSDL
jgi:ankyrin repeat protein